MIMSPPAMTQPQSRPPSYRTNSSSPSPPPTYNMLSPPPSAYTPSSLQGSRLASASSQSEDSEAGDIEVVRVYGEVYSHRSYARPSRRQRLAGLGAADIGDEGKVYRAEKVFWVCVAMITVVVVVVVVTCNLRTRASDTSVIHRRSLQLVERDPPGFGPLCAALHAIWNAAC